MNHMSDMLLHLNILNTALLMRLSSIYIEDLLGETASSDSIGKPPRGPVQPAPDFYPGGEWP